MSAVWKWIPFGLVLLVLSIGISVWGQADSLRAPSGALAPEPATTTPSAPFKPAKSREGVVVGFGHVDIEGGVVPLSVPMTGQVEQVLVKEGQRVRAGDPMIRLHGEIAQAQVRQAELAIKEARVRVTQAQRGPANQELLKKQQEIARDAARYRLEAATRQVEQFEKLSESSVVPDETFRSAKERLREVKSAVDAEELKLQQLALENPAEAIGLAETALAAAESRFAMAKEQLARHTLRAPEDGSVLRLMVSAGQVLGVNQQQPAIWFCPDRPMVVRCEIDEEFASRVQPGMTAELFSDEIGSAPIAGTVGRCADWIAHRRSLLDEPFQRNDVRTLECLVQVSASAPRLRIGQRMRVVIGARPSTERQVAVDAR